MPTARALLLVVMVLCLTSFSQAQGPSETKPVSGSGVAVVRDTFPDAPSFVRSASASPAAPDRSALEPAAIVARPVLAPVPQPKRKVLDKKFWFLMGFAVGTTILDVELTQRCLHHGTCVELNPTLPHGHAGMYLANVPVTGALFYWSYRRKAKGQRLWWLPTLGDALPHLGGSIDNMRFK